MRTAFITGESRGIGKANVDKFLEAGYKVITTSTSGKVSTEHENLTVFQFRLGNDEDVAAIVKALESGDFEGIDVFTNNAWKTQKKESEVELEILKDTLNTNLAGTVALTKALLPFINKNGVIINVSSEFGSLAEDWGCRVPSYCMAKAALNMFTRNFYANEKVKSKDIKVYSFDPGWVKN